ncbi:TPA_asm: maturation protein [ssRNA phage Gephyllon.2_12]|uniref:Maturation protein n=2 Tax=Fiersviridae TaxID=2842319 RepID=A0A8S5L3V0_9VIRU|nr:maturation protein [ssRNA phage Gephyllon.2_12]QDH88860.1 MAG: hypothetical protein H2BulkLitter12624_000004 [Leviviridae sp.]DAD51850.1 TPA_asm: maturation protein [ssRNA phage Gephyllon.2_12]
MPDYDQWVPDPANKVGSYTRHFKVWKRTPNWGKLQADDVPVNDYDDLRAQYSQKYYTGQFRTDTVTGEVVTVVQPQYLFFGYGIENELSKLMIATDQTNIVSRLFNEAQVKALGKLADQKINLAVALAEGRKTCEHILSTAMRVSNAYRALRKGRLGEVADILGVKPNKAHKSWLEYKYGWMPLLMDVKGAAEALAQQQLGRPLKFSVSSKASSAVKYSGVVPFTPAGGGPSVNGVRALAGSLEVRVKIYAELTSPHVSAAQQLGLTNPMLVAWELVPFSFVFDWFISVGDYLKSLTALQGVTVRKAMKSLVIDMNATVADPSTVTFDGRYRWDTGLIQCEAKLRQYQRRSFGVDVFELYPPSNLMSLDATKLITSLALLQATHR